MKLSISNIAWSDAEDTQVYEMMRTYGFSGLEIAPTRIFSSMPYDRIKEAREWSNKLKIEQGLIVPSMQSIWFGREERLFGTNEERQLLIEYTKKAIDFAVAIGCNNLVFGCPRNRVIPDGEDLEIGVKFFREIGNYAAEKGTVIGMEANPTIYNTNYINDTLSAINLVEKVNSKGFRLNLDVGTMIQNEENVDELNGKVHLINHVHISEPGLKPINERKLHTDLIKLLLEEQYNGFISIEMGRVETLEVLEDKLLYVKSIVICE